MNIAKETARLIGMGVNIHTGEETRNPTQERNQLIWESDGFAQVLPRDKREVVLVLKDIYKIVVGMTGDGEHLLTQAFYVLDLLLSRILNGSPVLLYILSLALPCLSATHHCLCCRRNGMRITFHYVFDDITHSTVLLTQV